MIMYIELHYVLFIHFIYLSSDSIEHNGLAGSKYKELWLELLGIETSGRPLPDTCCSQRGTSLLR